MSGKDTFKDTITSGTPFREIEWLEPLEAVQRLACGHRLAFLDSAVGQAELGRWSYVAVDPFGIFSILDGIARWNDAPMDGPPLDALRRIFARYSRPQAESGPPFQGGAIGIVHYEAASLFDDVAMVRGAPQIDLAFYDCVLAFDMARQCLYVTGPAQEQFCWPMARTAIGQAARVETWHDSRSRAAYEAEVRAIVDSIRNGDIFQANLAHRFTASLKSGHDIVATYKALRAANPAPFAALLINGEDFIASTSPERFLRLDGRHIETRPIKGTVRRNSDPETDRRQIEFLRSSEKDRAENIMIVDLLRNDLSRVAVADSVSVEQLCAIESYARLHHLVSVVTATLEPGLDWLDVLAASFPGGSITGAPKLKAMEIIARHEAGPRGVYCGAIGWIGFDGAMDLNIAIRTLTCSGGELTLNAGGGITLLSDPAAEYDETLLKAEAVMSALSEPGVLPVIVHDRPLATVLAKAATA